VPLQTNSAEKKRPLPLYALVFYGVLAFSLLIYLAAVLFSGFAAWFNGTVGAAVRALLAHLTSWLPFSLAEILLYALPLGIAAVGVLAWRRYCDTWRDTGRFLLSLLACVSLLFSVFVFSFGPGYRTPSLDQGLSLAPREVNGETLAHTLSRLVDEVNAAAESVSFEENGFSLMPYDLRELNGKLMTGYERLCEDYDFISSLKSRVKPVLASRAMSYTHITGVYTYFTGEANINVDFPPYTQPFTAAHELAHQRGIAREDEANFVAFLACVAADDAYIRYSAYLNLYEYVANALWEVDSEAYMTIAKGLLPAVKGELHAYAAFFEPLRDSAASSVSGAVNDTYLKLHGNEAGVYSYNLVVELAVAYFAQA